MENQKILGIVGVHYPYALSESFFHEELLVLSQHFTKIIVFLTDTHLLQDKKIYFQVPENVELVELETSVSLSEKTSSVFKLKPFELFSELKSRKPNFKLADKIQALKSVLYYESRSSLFEKSLTSFLTKRGIQPENIILYSYWLNEFTLGLTKLKSTSEKYKIYSRAHGWDVYEERHNPPFLPYRKRIILKLNGFFPISENAKNYILENFKISDQSNIKVARLGTSSLKFNDKMGENEKLNILSIAFLSPVKNIELLIEALAKLEVPFHWTHIGDGEDLYAQKIHQVAKASIADFENTVTFKGTIPNAEIKQFLETEEIDLLINTSASEGIPVSMMEALSVGIPVVGPNIGGILELISPDCGILLSEKPDAEEVKNTLEKYFSLSIDAKLEMKKMALKQWENKFNASANYKEFAHLLKGKES
jgi:glycosyltransferase involved in cell wall biosynthesis|tara:strand:- start:9270 stop:10538 length:1269 start_codon:yes stop_codon:yes gene_type:complete